MAALFGAMCSFFKLVKRRIKLFFTLLRAPLMVNSTHCYFVSLIIPNHLEATLLFFTLMVIYKIFMLGHTNLPHTLILPQKNLG